jgi:hypothetical protein
MPKVPGGLVSGTDQTDEIIIINNNNNKIREHCPAQAPVLKKEPVIYIFYVAVVIIHISSAALFRFILLLFVF